MAALVIGCGFFTLLNPLIEIWLGKQFLFDEAIVTYLIINFYLMYMRMAVNAFKNASGLYWNDRYKPIAEAVSIWRLRYILLLIMVWLGLSGAASSALC